MPDLLLLLRGRRPMLRRPHAQLFGDPVKHSVSAGQGARAHVAFRFLPPGAASRAQGGLSRGWFAYCVLARINSELSASVLAQWLLVQRRQKVQPKYNLQLRR